jgi:cytochrome c-type protein NapC
MSVSIPAIIAIVAGLLALLIGMRSQLTQSRGGKILAFLVFFLIPVLSTWGSFEGHMERAQSTGFCLSCHVMQDYGRSLYVDDPSYLAARHFQNNRVPRERACYTCHTDYTMFGGINSKIRGMRHLWIQYLGQIPKPEGIKLYTPYDNRECLHCHLGARRFEEASAHQKTPDQLTRAKAGQLSCLSGGCHDIIHDVETLKDAPFWKGAQ